jgi:heme/copper-type cytochrome/quinol oxidase subunit 4
MSQEAQGGPDIEQRKRNMRMVGVAGAIGDLITIAVFWLMPADTFPDQTLYIITIVLAVAAVYLIWVTHIFLPKRWDKAARGPP